jgi:uncharacterized repeat protein (TIGR01451 family)
MKTIYKLSRHILVVGFSLLYVFFPFMPEYASADPFYPSGDAQYCDFAMGTSISYRGLPSNCTGPNCMSYDNGLVSGESGSYPETHNIRSIADLAYPNAHRFRGVADRVAVPPNTRIDIGYYVYNYSGHTITAHNAFLFTSRPNPADGDWTRLGAGGTYGNVPYYYYGVNGTRDGKHVQTGNIGTYGVSSYSNPPTGRTIYSFTTIQPIQIVSRTNSYEFLSGGRLRIRYDLTIRNTSSYVLPNVQIIDDLPSGEQYGRVYTFQPNETQRFTYYADMGTSYPTNITTTPARVYDPNRHSETTAVGSDIRHDTSPETRTILVERDDAGVSNWTGKQYDFTANPGGDYFKIELIPYTVYSPENNLNVPPNITIDKVVSDDDETRVEANDSEPNEVITYDITVTNTGGNATGVSVVDDYDERYLTILDADGGTISNGRITWNIGTLTNQETRTFTIEAQITDNLAHGIYQAPNTVTIETDQTPPQNDQTNTTITAEVILDLQKLVSDSDEANTSANHIQGAHPEDAERTMTYTITAENNGTADSHNTYIEDDVSEILQYGDIVSISNGGVLTTRDNNGQLEGSIRWNIGTFQKGQSISRTFDVLLHPGIEDLTNIENIAGIHSDEVEPVYDNTITTVHAPVLEIEKDDGIEGAEPADTVFWNVIVSNTGTGNAYNVEVYDYLPDYLTVSNISDDGAFDETNRRIVWSTVEPQYILNGSYAPDDRSIWGNRKVLSFETVLDDLFPVGTAELENVAYTETPFYPPAETEHILPVEAYPILDIEKYVLNETAVDDGRAYSGENVSDVYYGADSDLWYDNANDVKAVSGDVLHYTLTYSNTGNADSPDTHITDVIPKYVLDENGEMVQVVFPENIINISDGYELTETDNEIILSWDIGVLPVSDELQTLSYEIILSVDETPLLSDVDEDRRIENVAEIYSDDDRVEPDSDNAIIETGQAILTLEKTQELPDVVTPGSSILYTLNFGNIGTGYAPDVYVFDELPEHTYFIEFVDTPESIEAVYNEDENRLEWRTNGLDVDESNTVSFRLGVDIPTLDSIEIINEAFMNSRVNDTVASTIMTATISSCCMDGVIYEDVNQNRIQDKDENGIEGAVVSLSWKAGEYFPEDTRETLTDQTGVYGFRGLPYFVPLTLSVDPPDGYDKISTDPETVVVLLPPDPEGDPVDYIDEETGIRYITAGTCMKLFDAGIYKEIIFADTGAPYMEYILITLAIILISSTSIYFLIRKK